LEASSPVLDEWDRWFHRYYENPQQRKAVKAIRFFDKNHLFERADSEYTMVGFFSGMFERYHKRVPIWFNQFLDLSLSCRKMMYKSLYFSDKLQNLRFLETKVYEDEELSAFIKDRVLNIPLFSEQKVPQSGEELDFCWGRWFFSGEKKWLDRIMSVIDSKLATNHPIRVAAEWSLISNAINHSRVYESVLEKRKSKNIYWHYIFKAIQKKLIRLQLKQLKRQR
jgi:hypothetical protein